jgi:hypothetical protein
MRADGPRTRRAMHMEKPDDRHRRLLRPRGERCSNRRAAECSQQIPPSDRDWHVPSRARVPKETIPRHERAVFTSCFASHRAAAYLPRIGRREKVRITFFGLELVISGGS